MSPAPALWPHVEQAPPQKIPNLVPIDLSKAERHNHPDIKPDERVWYLVKYANHFYAGLFEWDELARALIFHPNSGGEYDEEIYFHAPGWNRSRWEAVWEILP